MAFHGFAAASFGPARGLSGRLFELGARLKRLVARSLRQRDAAQVTLRQQLGQDVALATRHGVSAFCFNADPGARHNGQINALTRFIADPSLSMHFCVAVAASDLAALAPSPVVPRLQSYLADPRYLRQAGRPILLVDLRLPDTPRARALLAEWHKRLIQQGLGDLFLIGMVSNNAASQSRPSAALIGLTTGQAEPQLPLVVLNDLKWHRQSRERRRAYFDAAARYKKELEQSLRGAPSGAEGCGPLSAVLVSAWQPCGRAPGLAPDPHFGHAFLHATSATLESVPASAQALAHIEALNRTFKPRHDACIVLHLYYEDLIGALVETLIAPLRDSVDLIVSVLPSLSATSIERIRQAVPNSYFLIVDNRGRDVRPFLIALRHMTEFGYRYGCKIHSKKSPHRSDGDAWRDAMVSDLLGSRATVMDCLSRLQQEPDLGLLAPIGALTPLDQRGEHHSNRLWLDRLEPSLVRQSGAPASVDVIQPIFPAGTMFWFKTVALQGLLRHPDFDESTFEPELGQLDGTLAHALERLMALQVQHAGLRAAEVKQPGQRDTVPATDAT